MHFHAEIKSTFYLVVLKLSPELLLLLRAVDVKVLFKR